MSRFQLLGPGGPLNLGSRKLCGLVAALACAPGLTLPRERLAALFWGSHFEVQAQQNLRQALARLRRLLGGDILVSSDHTVSLAPGRIESDVSRFQALLKDGSRPALLDALELYRDGFLADVSIPERAWTEWLLAERSRLEGLALDALVRLGEAELDEGRPEAALASGRRAIGIDDLREDAHRLVIGSLAAVGRRAEALRHYEDLSASLKRRLNVEPDQLTQALGEGIRANEAPARPVLDRMAVRLLSGDSTGLLVAEATNGRREAHQALVEEACRAVTQAHQGRFVGANGAQPMLAFPDARAATAAGFSILKAVAAATSRAGHDSPPVRMGIHVAPTMPGEGGPTGTDLVFVQRLARLAGAGEIVMSSEARERITASLDAEVDDLGERPVPGGEDMRGFRLSQPSRETSLALSQMESQVWPTIAVVPFTTYSDDPSAAVLGDILADEIIVALSQSNELNVISRLSTTALRARNLAPHQIRSLVNATYVLSGACHVAGRQIRLIVEFTDARTGQIVWADTVTTPIDQVLASAGVVDHLVAGMTATIMQVEMKQARLAPFERLEDCTLLIGAIALMHQMSLPKLELACAMLEALVARAPGHAAPHAWLAMTYVLRASQGWSTDFGADARQALDSAERALDEEPGCSLALAIDAHVHTHFFRRFDRADERFGLAVESSPNNALAWLLKSTLHTFKGEGPLALEAADRALRLSPLDPRRWYYDALAASAMVAAGDYDRAIELARRSIRGNRTHTSSFRALTIAQSLAGHMEEARQTAAELMRLQPDLTATLYRQRHPSGAFDIGATWADALRRAGVPE